MPKPPPVVRAAGVVAFRRGRRVLLVHRPSYDDWSFPKGKLDRGEHQIAAAVREVAEETGVHVRLTRPLSVQTYPVGARTKEVHYWTGRPVGDDDVSGYRPNKEIDAVEWVPVDEAVERLSYPRDQDLLQTALGRRPKTRAIIVLRHGEARSRRAWRQDDIVRPLLKRGQDQAHRLVPLLAAYDVTRVVSSPATRCLQTVEPFLSVSSWELERQLCLSEERAKPKAIRNLMEDLLADDQGAVVCTHRPVLPLVLDALGIEDQKLEPGEFLVAHIRKERVIDLERHRA